MNNQSNKLVKISIVSSIFAIIIMYFNYLNGSFQFQKLSNYLRIDKIIMTNSTLISFESQFPLQNLIIDNSGKYLYYHLPGGPGIMLHDLELHHTLTLGNSKFIS